MAHRFLSSRSDPARRIGIYIWVWFCVLQVGLFAVGLLWVGVTLIRHNWILRLIRVASNPERWLSELEVSWDTCDYIPIRCDCRLYFLAADLSCGYELLFLHQNSLSVLKAHWESQDIYTDVLHRWSAKKDRLMWTSFGVNFDWWSASSANL